MEVGVCPSLGSEYTSADSSLITYSPEVGLNLCLGLFFTYLTMKKQKLLGPSSLTLGLFSVADFHNFITGFLASSCSGLVVGAFIILHDLFK